VQQVVLLRLVSVAVWGWGACGRTANHLGSGRLPVSLAAVSCAVSVWPWLATYAAVGPFRAPQRAYLELRTTKLLSAGLSGSLVLVCLVALLALWSAAAAVPTGEPGLDRLLLLTAVLLTGLSVASAAHVLVRHRGVARRLSLWPRVN
jgi:hypothetical protein